MKAILYPSAVVIALCTAGPADANPIGNSRDEIRDAISEAKDSSGKCRKRVLSDLKSIKRDLSDLEDEPSEKLYRRIKRDLKDVRSDAEDHCPKSVTKYIRRSLRTLVRLEQNAGQGEAIMKAGLDMQKNMLKSAMNHDDDFHHQEPAVDAPGKPKAPCWKFSDPGCNSTKVRVRGAPSRPIA